MGFRTGSWATVWSVENGNGNTMKVRLSISRKNKSTGEYEQDFSGFCTFIGAARVKAERLKPKDRIKLGDTDVSTWYNKEKGSEYVNYKVFDFEPQDGGSNTESAHPKASLEEGDTEDEDYVPF